MVRDDRDDRGERRTEPPADRRGEGRQPEGAMGTLLTLRPHLERLMGALQAAHSAMALQCAVSTVARFRPGVRRLPGFEALHRENYEVAYHLTTAIGAAHMLQMGAQQPEFVATIIECLHEAMEHEQRAAGHLRQMHGAAGTQARPLVEQIQGHLQRTIGQMQAAQGLLNQQLGPELVRRLRAWSERQGG